MWNLKRKKKRRANKKMKNTKEDIAIIIFTAIFSMTVLGLCICAIFADAIAIDQVRKLEEEMRFKVEGQVTPNNENRTCFVNIEEKVNEPIKRRIYVYMKRTGHTDEYYMTNNTGDVETSINEGGKAMIEAGLGVILHSLEVQ